MITRYAILDDNDLVVEIIETEINEKKLEIENIISDFFPGKKIIKQNEKENVVKMFSVYKKNMFVDPSPFESWELKESKWIAPVPYPKDGNTYIWNEEKKDWEKFNIGD